MKATLKENEEKIVSVSELNNGGAGKIFLDLQKNNSEYIILKNDRPAAVLLSMDKYEKLAEKSEKLDALMEVVENTELLLLANQAEMSPTVPFEEILKKEGITEEELEKLSESVYDKLEGSVRKQVLSGIWKVSQSPLPAPEGFGKPLGNKGGENLTGFFKIKYRGIGIRVVYTLVKEKKIMNIVVISERNAAACYKQAAALYYKYGDELFQKGIEE